MTGTTIVDNRPVDTRLTANALLFGTGTRSAEALGQAMSDHHAARTALRSTRRLSRSAARLVDRQVATAMEGLLDLDLGDVLITAWQQHAKLAEAARRTLAGNAREETVSLPSHTIQTTYAPHVDLAVNRTLVHCFRFILDLVVEVAELDAVIRAGTLTKLRTGDCTMTATLTLDGKRLATVRRPANLDRIINLHPGRSLIDNSADVSESPTASSA